MISIVVAMDLNNVIGKDNKLIWHIPGDLKNFKKITTGHSIVMGRKTFESIGRPLPRRENIILTKNIDFKVEGCKIYNSIEPILELSDDREVFIIGGAEIYKLFLPYTDMIYMTLVHNKFDGDTFFPSLSADEWDLINLTKPMVEDNHVYDFRILKNINNWR